MVHSVSVLNEINIDKISEMTYNKVFNVFVEIFVRATEKRFCGTLYVTYSVCSEIVLLYFNCIISKKNFRRNYFTIYF